ncbi:TauD/TfdA family dioxygenase [Dongia soli]|uniref:TauD/TfdA family dioxygenase n=1 Tax=Dongia soli TaxID=600628 RepID=A0ABU5E9B8_9PROT|nr:TauD/TfdA family dioxygenase [Dongia soli]MDY0882872.1 TauD/TfdA family dioxygenase [Dongia soli]
MSIELVSASVTGDAVQIARQDGRTMVFPAIWLRDNCRCSACRHANGQRLFEITDLPRDLALQQASIQDGRLRLVWTPDDHISEFEASWLAAHELGGELRAARREQPVLWDRSLIDALPAADWNLLRNDPAVELGWLDKYAAYGFGLLRNVPAETGMVEVVGNHLGFVRVTNYGSLFDVISVPKPNNLAYTAVGLGVHSDNPYREPTPGVQLLHCLESNAPGGDTLLVDGFHAAEVLRRENPAGFELLTQLPLRFRFRDAKTDLQAEAPLIGLDFDGAVKEIHFNNRSADILDAPVDLVAPWYAAYRNFAEILKRPEMELVFRLGPGDLVVMMNERALHGRTAFDPSLGRRHLQGCYIDKDGIESRRRVLRRQLGLSKDLAA